MNRRHCPTSFSTVFVLTVLVTVSAAGAATLNVDTDIDVDAFDGLCSLREAITAANDDVAHGDCPSGDGADRIDFDLALPAIILLTDHLPAITAPLAIRGPGALSLAVDGDTLYRPFDIDAPGDDGWVLIEDLSITNGHTPADDDLGGGARVAPGDVAIFRRVRFIGNRADNGAGGLHVSSRSFALAQVTLRHCLFADNVAEGPTGGGGLFVEDNGSVLQIFGSTFFGNRAEHDNGGGAGLRAIDSELVIEGSTVSGNTANSNGGGIHVTAGLLNPTNVTLRHSTITENIASADLVGGGGGGINFRRTGDPALLVTIENTVVADNIDLGSSGSPEIECFGDPDLIATGSNFVASNEGCQALFPAGLPNPDGNFVGTTMAPLFATLGPLGDHGGPTATHAPFLVPLSPLIDQGSCPGVVGDQRGYGENATGQRPVNLPEVPDAAGGDSCDIGAVEVRAAPNVDPSIFADGFETGHTLLWAAERP